MYQKYQTDALVLGSRESGENDRVYALYTKDFGLVRARATAVRKESSRMRYALQNYSHASVGLVRGNRGWRVGGATAIKTGAGDARGTAAFARVAELIVRLVQGEERNPYLFAAIAEAHDALIQEHCDSFATIEIVCVARVLFALGYLSAEAFETTLFSHTAYANEHMREAEVMREKLLSSINKAIAETQL